MALRRKKISTPGKKYAFMVGTTKGPSTIQKRWFGTPVKKGPSTNKLAADMGVIITHINFVAEDDPTRFVVDNESQAFFCHFVFHMTVTSENKDFRAFIVEL